MISFFKKKNCFPLAGVAQWIECQPENQRAACLVPSHGTCRVSGQVPSRGRPRGNRTLMFLSLSFSLPFPLSKNKINKIFFIFFKCVDFREREARGEEEKLRMVAPPIHAFIGGFPRVCQLGSNRNLSLSRQRSSQRSRPARAELHFLTRF